MATYNRKRFPATREPLSVTMRRNRAAFMAQVSPEHRERAERDFPESGLPPLPKKRAPRQPSASSEHAEQAIVVKWWNAQCGLYGLPHFALYAIPNGAYLASGYMGAGKLKAEGMRAGMVDLCLAVPHGQHHGWYGEMKYGKNKASDEQLVVLDYLKRAGYATGTYWSADDAIAAIKEYLA